MAGLAFSSTIADMELIWFNGNVTPLAEATASIEDRGFQFADGVYEVIRVYGGKTFTLQEHLERLERSAKDILITLPMSVSELAGEVRSLVAKSGMREGMIYLQISRGVAPRDHRFPKNIAPTLLFYNRDLPEVPEPGTAPGVKLISMADERWKRCWIKAIALLPNVLAKNAALVAGGDEALFVDNGLISECSTSNFYIISKGKLITHPVGPKVLPGITRQVLLPIAREMGIAVEERPVTVDEVRAADEIFITSTTREVGWVVSVDGKTVGTGKCGPITLKLHRALQEKVRRATKGEPIEMPAMVGMRA
jgi:D-alanine transaminase